MNETRPQIVHGVCDDGETAYVPGVNCFTCGKFVGRDGHIEIECFEMSLTVAGVTGWCGPCLIRACERDAADAIREHLAEASTG